MKKKIFIYYLIIQMLILSISSSIYTVPVYASTLSDNIREAQEARDAILDYFDNATHIPSTALNNFFKAVGTGVGFLVGGFALSEANFRSIFNGKNYGGITFDSYDDQEATDDVARFMVDNVNITNNSITFNNGSNTALKDLIDWNINQFGYVYSYTYDVRNLQGVYDTNFLNALHVFFGNHTSGYVMFAPNSNTIIYRETDNDLFFSPLYLQSGFSTTTSYMYDDASLSNNNVPHNIIDFERWNYNTTTHLFEKVGSIGSYTNQMFAHDLEPRENWIYSDRVTFWVEISYNEYKVRPIYPTLQDYQKYQQYYPDKRPYYVTQYYGDFVNNSGNTYTVNDENYNPITYGDINTWIEDNTPAGGNPPTDTEIKIYIDNYIPNSDPDPDPDPTPTPTPNPDNPNNPSTGGGSNTVSGNGSSSATANATANATNGNVNVTINNNPSISLGWPTLSGNGVSDNTVSGNTITGGVDNIFGFISYLGQVLGNLIKNVGNALVDLVEGIAEIIASIFEAIPNVFNDFMTGVFGWLPAELRALIVLAISAMLIVGIIKLIRG